jgi:hypothetical protein
MKWAYLIYETVGVPYPRGSLVFATFLGALLFGGGWRLLGLQYAKDHVQTTGAPTEKRQEPGSGIAAGGNVAGGDVSVVIGITPEQYEAGLKRREEEIRNERTQGRPTDKGKLDSQLDDTQARLQNPEAALADHKATLDQAREGLDKLEGEFSPQELAQANEGLKKGDPSNAERLFRRILGVSGSTVSLVGS